MQLLYRSAHMSEEKKKKETPAQSWLDSQFSAVIFMAVFENLTAGRISPGITHTHLPVIQKFIPEHSGNYPISQCDIRTVYKMMQF